jgi:hypothetical protein
MPDIKDLAVYYHVGRPDSNCSLCVYCIPIGGMLRCMLNDMAETTNAGRCGVIILKPLTGK